MKRNLGAVIGAGLFGAFYFVGTWYPPELIPYTLFYVAGMDDVWAIALIIAIYSIIINGGKIIFGAIALKRIAPKGVRSLYMSSGVYKLKNRLNVRFSYIESIKSLRRFQTVTALMITQFIFMVILVRVINAPRFMKKIWGSVTRTYNVALYVTVEMTNSKSPAKRLLGYVMLFVYGFTPGITTVGLVIAILNRNRTAQAVVVLGDLLRLYLFVISGVWRN